MGERIKELVDRGFELSAKIKELEKSLAEVKGEIKAYAKKHKSSSIEGQKSVATLSPYTTTTCAPEDLLAKLKELKRAGEFTSLVNVAIGPTKKAIGEMILSEIAETNTIPYHVVKFKKSQ